MLLSLLLVLHRNFSSSLHVPSFRRLFIGKFTILKPCLPRRNIFPIPSLRHFASWEDVYCLISSTENNIEGPKAISGVYTAVGSKKVCWLKETLTRTSNRLRETDCTK